MPKLAGTANSSNELSSNEEDTRRLYFTVYWKELRLLLPNVFSYHDQLAACIDEDTLQTLITFASAMAFPKSTRYLQGNEQALELTDWLLDALLNSKKECPFFRFYQFLKNNEFTAAIELLRSPQQGQQRKFFQRLAEFYSHAAVCNGEQSTKQVLAKPALLAVLADLKSLTKQDQKLVEEAKDDNLLLSILTSKRQSWCEELVLALCYDQQFQHLELLLPGFADYMKQTHNCDVKNLQDAIDDEDELKRIKEVISSAIDIFLVTNQQNQVEDEEGAAGLAECNAVKKPFPDLLDEANKSNTSAQQGSALTFGQLTLTDLEEEQELKQEQKFTKQQLRDYQRELARPGMEGDNCVIIAPTGSGKTLVSLEIAKSLLEKRPDAKVAFLADRASLVDQQKAAYEQQMPPQFKVKMLRGGNNDFPLRYALQDFSVHILSTQILLNALKNNSEDGLAGDLSKFQLLIFDECHHCDKDHPSKKIMDLYFDFKEKHGGENLPQVIGLTASPGTGNATSLTETVKHIKKICANLDCHRLVTVREAEAALRAHVSDPLGETHCVQSKRNDLVQDKIEELMELAETLLEQESRNAKMNIPKPPMMRGHFTYTNFCGNLANSVCEFSNEASKAVFACQQLLTNCNTALYICSLFCSTDALHFLRERLLDASVLAKEPTCPVDKQLRDKLLCSVKEMKQFCNDEPLLAGSSPALEKLHELLDNQFSNLPDSRVIVFVQQRYYTVAVKNYIDRSLSQLPVRAEVMTGANASGSSGGITQTRQDEILKDFRLGKLKILISTSVSEEGIDVEKCNMVVRFCHVTNEIAMVQSKGRGRAENSSYHVIVPEQQKWLEEKEKTNQLRNDLMMRAVQKITDMDAGQFKEEMEQLQDEQQTEQQILKEKQLAEEAQAAAAAAPQLHIYKLLCKGCNAVACNSDELRRADKHYIVLGNDIVTDKRFKLIPNVNSSSLVEYSMQCGNRNCSQKWGSLRKYKSVVFPMLDVRSFKFFRIDNNLPIRANIKKWTDTGDFFEVIVLTNAELKIRISQLLDSRFQQLVLKDEN